MRTLLEKQGIYSAKLITIDNGVACGALQIVFEKDNQIVWQIGIRAMRRLLAKTTKICKEAGIPDD